MCGIAGILAPRAQGSAFISERILRAMATALAHRGPDAEGIWLDAETGIGLAHRRLSILDLSPAGGQPMVSSSGRSVLVFNGEIYNHQAIRADLAAAGAAHTWRGHSDTETLLAAIAAWGIEKALRGVQGMFALALWDRKEEALILARDRMGEKPLYLARCDGGWAFGSELKALRAAPGFRPRLDHGAISAFLAFGYVPEGQCIYQDVSKVPPGCFVRIDRAAPRTAVHTYHAFDNIVAEALHDRSARGAAEHPLLVREMEETLSSVIDEQMLSDVPLGCFLSGGIDSSLVAALMQAQRETPIRSFSIGFDVAHLNEAPHAAKVARHLGTDHAEFILSEEDALAVVSDLPRIYSEPFADSSQIPTVLLCREARRAVTVALTGDGGDEVFGGYNRHILGPGLLHRARRLPRWLLRAGARTATGVERLRVRNETVLRRLTGALGLPVTTIDKLARLGAALAHLDDIPSLYRHLITTFDDPSEILGQQTLSVASVLQPPSAFSHLEAAEWMMAMDTAGYLPGDILVKVDRAAMSASLETRAPFLDSRVVAASWRLPPEARIRGRSGKAILRDILERHVPRATTDRPKQGFAVPIDRWLRGALRSWADELLGNEEHIALAGLDSSALAALWQHHLAGKANHGQKLWTVLMLLAWLAENAEDLSVADTANCAA